MGGQCPVKVPDVAMLQSFGYITKKGVFFIPRRTLTEPWMGGEFLQGGTTQRIPENLVRFPIDNDIIFCS